MLGAIWGSFIATLVARWGQGRSITGRSACDQCHRPLGPLHLIPLLSWIALRGRCATCGAPIGMRQLLVEGLALLIGIGAAWVVPGWGGWALAAFGWQMLALGLMDLEYRRLPHILTVLLAISGFAASALGWGVEPMASVIGAATGFGTLWIIGRLYRLIRGRVGLGGGDPMMLGGIGAWLGWAWLPMTLLLASVLGLGWAALLHVRIGRVTSATAVPFGLMLALAATPLLALLLSGRL